MTLCAEPIAASADRFSSVLDTKPHGRGPGTTGNPEPRTHSRMVHGKTHVMRKSIRSHTGKSHRALYFRYGGASMAPTLKASDVLRVIPYGERKIRSGDTVVFRSPGSDRLVVHRVLSAGPGGIRTKGDNNLHGDPWVLSEDRIIGRVTSARRATRGRRISGGLAGRVRALSCWAMRRARSEMISWLRPAYLALAGSGLLRGCLPPALAPRMFVFEGRGRKRLRLMVGRRVVGRALAGENRWRISAPFRPFCDPESLPPIPFDHGHETP